MKNKISKLIICLYFIPQAMCLAQLTPIIVGGSPNNEDGDAPRTAWAKQNANNSFLSASFALYENKILLDPLTLNSLTNQWYYNTNTAFVSVRGSDATAAIGDVNRPSKTFGNAYSLLPQMGGAIWFLGGTFTNDTGANILKDMTVVAINSTFHPSTEQFGAVSNFTWIGGELDAVFKPAGTVGVQNYRLSNVKIYPDSGMVNVDCIFGTGSVWVNNCILNTSFDAVTPQGSNMELTMVNSLAHADATSDPFNAARAISLTAFSGTFSGLIKDSTLIAVGSTNFNAGVYSTRAGTVYDLDNVQIFVGTNTCSTNIFLAGAGTAAILRNMPLLGNNAAVSGAVIYPQQLPGNVIFNAVALPTNFIAANFAPIANCVRLSPSNNWMYSVTELKTNQAWQFNP